MRTEKRRVTPGVVQTLLLDPHRFEFFQALRVLEHLFQRQGEAGAGTLDSCLRFRNSLSLSFPASDIEAIDAYSTDDVRLDREAAIDYAIGTESVGRVYVTPAFSGFLGISGVLPLHYTELFAQREIYERDRAGRAFLDVFANRALALHYQAWKKYRLGIQYELERRERFLPLVLALSGLGMRALRDQFVDGDGDIHDQAIAHFAGGIGQRPVSATFLQQLLSDYFRVDIRVEQFVGAWYQVPESARSCLGVGNVRLGSSALAGDRVWQRDLRMRLWVGPLCRRQFDDFLPNGHAAKALAKWLTLLTGACLEHEVRLVLRAEDVVGASLDAGKGMRLGWDGFLCSREEQAPRADLGYTIQTLQ